MASATAARALAGSCVHTCGRLTFAMIGPPDFCFSLEDRNQLGNGSRGYHRRVGARLLGKIGAAHRNVSKLIGKKLDLAMTDVSWQIGNPSQLQNPAV
jgi:hypothetical protein